MSAPRLVGPSGGRTETAGIDAMINATVSLLFALLTRRLALVSALPSAIHALATAGLLRGLVDAWFAGTGSVELQGLTTSPERERSSLEWMLDRDPAELLSPTLGAPPPILTSWLTTRREAAFDALEEGQSDQDVFEEHQRQLDRDELVSLRAELVSLRAVRAEAVAYIGAMSTEEHVPSAYKARQALIAAVTRAEEVVLVQREG